jgi:hypothetical protein
MTFIATRNYENDVYCYKTARLKLAAPKSRLKSFSVTTQQPSHI